jgi:hypothetical protein
LLGARRAIRPLQYHDNVRIALIKGQKGSEVVIAVLKCKQTFVHQLLNAAIMIAVTCGECIMAVEITLSVPEEMMQLARKVADDANMSVEVVLLDWLQHPIPKPTLTDIDAQLDTLSSTSDIHLWTVVHRHLEASQEQRLNEIVDKHEGGEALTPNENAEWADLNEWVGILMLLRSQALVLLKERGYDVTRFFKPQRKYS